jgi:hypothetical protein
MGAMCSHALQPTDPNSSSLGSAAAGAGRLTDCVSGAAVWTLAALGGAAGGAWRPLDFKATSPAMATSTIANEVVWERFMDVDSLLLLQTLAYNDTRQHLRHG